jgi:C1A family cysteine protease
MMYYKTGIMKESSMKCSIVDPITRIPIVDHAVTIVGYKLDSTLDTECKGYFIIKNSWGK